MTWLSWIEWFSKRPSGSLAPNIAITLVTLRVSPSAVTDEVSFYRSAEYDTLLEWARMGRFILALASADRDELTLLCVQSPAEMEAQIADLPRVATGLATYDIRPVMSLRMDDDGQLALH